MTIAVVEVEGGSHASHFFFQVVVFTPCLCVFSLDRCLLVMAGWLETNPHTWRGPNTPSIAHLFGWKVATFHRCVWFGSSL